MQEVMFMAGYKHIDTSARFLPVDLSYDTVRQTCIFMSGKQLNRNGSSATCGTIRD